MKKYAFLVGLLLLPLGLRAQDAATAGVNFVNFNPLEVYPVNKWGAYNPDDDPLTLVDQSPDSLNVVTDDGPGLTGRKGFVSLSTEPLKAMWVLPHSSGTRYKLGQSSGTLKASLDGITYDITVSTVDSQYTTAGAVVGDTFYFSDLTNGLKSATFSGSVPTVVSVSTSLKFSMLIAAQGRLMGAGIPGSERILRISEYTPNEDNFTLVANSSDTMPAAITIPGALDEPISGLYSSFRGYPVVFKPHSFGILYGTRRSNFGYQKYSDQVGTAYPESVQDCDGILRWLGPSRTIWEFNGVGWKDISNDPVNRKRINTFLSTVAQGDFAQRTHQFTSQTDFDLGSSTQVTGHITSGSLLVSTWIAGDTTSDHFALGTSVNTDTTTVSGQVQLSINNNDPLNDSFESGNVDNWTISGAGGYTPTQVSAAIGTTPQDGTAMMLMMDNTANKTVYLQVLVSAAVIAQSSVVVGRTSSNANTWLGLTLDSSAYKGREIQIRIRVVEGGAGTWGDITSDAFLCSGGTISVQVYGTTSGTDDKYLFVDNLDNGRSTITSGTFISRAFDTGFSSAAWTPPVNAYELNTKNHPGTVVYTQSSADGTVWESSVAWTSGQAPLSGWNRYIRYQVDFNTGGAGTGQAYFAAGEFSARASTGSWVSPSFQTAGMSAFGVFSANHSTDGGNITYAIYTDSDSTKFLDGRNIPIAGSYLSSATVSNGTIPTLSTTAYAFGTAYYSITASTQNPSTQDLTYTWLTGSTLRVASAFPNKRYWLSVAVSSTANNRVLVYDKNEDWQLYSGINATSMIFDSNLYFSNQSGVFQGETGYNDNGASITSYYKTPTLALGGLDNFVKFHSLRLTTAESASTLSTTYQFNGDGTDYSFGSYAMNQATGYQNFKLPFPTSEVSQGKFLNLKFSVTGTAYWRILNASIYHRKDLLPR